MLVSDGQIVTHDIPNVILRRFKREGVNEDVYKRQLQQTVRFALMWHRVRYFLLQHVHSAVSECLR